MRASPNAPESLAISFGSEESGAGQGAEEADWEAGAAGESVSESSVEPEQPSAEHGNLQGETVKHTCLADFIAAFHN